MYSHKAHGTKGLKQCAHTVLPTDPQVRRTGHNTCGRCHRQSTGTKAVRTAQHWETATHHHQAKPFHGGYYAVPLQQAKARREPGPGVHTVVHSVRTTKPHKPERLAREHACMPTRPVPSVATMPTLTGQQAAACRAWPRRRPEATCNINPPARARIGTRQPGPCGAQDGLHRRALQADRAQDRLLHSCCLRSLSTGRRGRGRFRPCP